MKGVSGLKAGHSKVIYFITDALSTVRDVVNSSGAVLASYEFDEYGRRLPPSMTNTVESQKTFVGGMSVQDEVADTGLMMMGHRFYAPDHGRFLNRDPIGFEGGWNLFEYARSNPARFTDATGLAPFDLDDPRATQDWFRNQANLAVDRGDHLEAFLWSASAVSMDVSGFTTAQDAGEYWGGDDVTFTGSLYYSVMLIGAATSVSSWSGAARAGREIAVDANVLIDCRAGILATNKILQGRTPVISPAALEEMVKGTKWDIWKMKYIFGARFSQIDDLGLAESFRYAAAARGQSSWLTNPRRINDSRVAANALREGLVLYTGDGLMFRAMQNIGFPAIRYTP